MRDRLRFGFAAFAAALALALGTPAAAQDASPPPPPPAETPATDAVGPRELRDFSLPGTVTRPVETPPARPAPAPTTRPAPVTTRPAPTAAQPRETPATREPAAPRPATTRPSTTSERPAPPPRIDSNPAASPSAALPGPAGTITTTLPPADPAPVADASPPVTTTPLDASQTGPSPLPWLLAFALLGAGGFYLWRQRVQPAFAGAGGGYRAAPAPGSTPAPVPTPAPRPLQRAAQPRPATPPRPAPAPAPPSPSSLGIVSTRIRPWLELEFTPTRCVLAEDKATIEFDIVLFNSGSAPARDVLVEGAMFNAGATQDEEIGRFFAAPVGEGDRIPVIEPLRKLALKSAVSLRRDQLREFEAGGRRLFVPMLGFNALYKWSSGTGQTSTSYLVGRATDAAKLAPFRLDLGPRLFRGLAAREHNTRVRH